MKYEVTPRGWLVLTILIIIILIPISKGIGKLITPNNKEDTNLTIESNTINDEEINEEINEEANETTNEVTDETTNEEANEMTDESNIQNEIQYDDFYLNIYFDKNSSELKVEKNLDIKEVKNILLENKNITLIIEGHINGYPYYDDGDFGLGLSLERATIIKSYFIENGILENRIKLINIGSSSQIDDSEDLDKHYLNRRGLLYFEYIKTDD